MLDAFGKPVTQSELIKTWRVKIAQTVLFPGEKGQEIAPRLAGGTTSDFYGAYLDERISLANQLPSLTTRRWWD